MMTAMMVTLDIPDAIGLSLQRTKADLQRAFLEAFAVEGYRDGTLSAAEVRLLLGHDSRWETEDFLAAHDAWPAPTEDEVIAGADVLKSLRGA